MKKSMSVMLASIIVAAGCSFSGGMSMAAEQSELPHTAAENDGETDSMEPSEDGINGNGEDENTGIVTLQLPQKLEIILDPWEMDGNSQIYSEQYVLRNTGEEEGVLVLSNLICSLNEQEGVIVRTDNEGIHNGKDKFIYMEMALDNGDSVIFTQDGSRYEVRLAPGEEMAFWFQGEVNECAASPWVDGDFEVTVAYSWNIDNMDIEETASYAEEDEAGETEPAARVNETEETESALDAGETRVIKPAADADETGETKSDDNKGKGTEQIPENRDEEETVSGNTVSKREISD